MKGTYRNPRQRHADTVRSEARAQALNNRLAMVASSTSATLAASQARMAQLRGMFSPPRGSAARWSVRTPWSTRMRSRKEQQPEPEHYAEMIGAVSAAAGVAAL